MRLLVVITPSDSESFLGCCNDTPVDDRPIVSGADPGAQRNPSI
jgi:hypothetical protein